MLFKCIYHDIRVQNVELDQEAMQKEKMLSWIDSMQRGWRGVKTTRWTPRMPEQGRNLFTLLHCDLSLRLFFDVAGCSYIWQRYIYIYMQKSANIRQCVASTCTLSNLHCIHRCFLKPCWIFESRHPSSPRKREARMFNVEKRRLRALTGQRDMMCEMTCWLSVVDRRILYTKHSKIVQLNQSRHVTNTCVHFLGVTSAPYKIWGGDGEDAAQMLVKWSLIANLQRVILLRHWTSCCGAFCAYFIADFPR